MRKVKILVKGYVKEKNGEEFASSSAVLIRYNNLNIIVDPGMDKKALLESLSGENLKTKDINFVILTHTHIDHCLLAGIFENAEILDDSNIYSFSGKIIPHNNRVPGTDIEIIKTPGHDPFHCSVLVDAEDLGKTAIAGDVFWWADKEEQKTNKKGLLERKDPYAENEKMLKESREKILELANYIIPGHGEMFKVSK